MKIVVNMGWKFVLAFLLGMLACHCYYGQQIYTTSNKYAADLIVYVTDNKYEADNLIYITDNRFEAGWPCEELNETRCGRWYMTEWRHQANLHVYFTSSRFEADRVIYYTNNKYEAFFDR